MAKDMRESLVIFENYWPCPTQLKQCVQLGRTGLPITDLEIVPSKPLEK